VSFSRGMARRKDSVKEIEEVKELDRCGQCSKVVTDKESGLQCEICDGWFYAICQDLSEDDYKVLSRLDPVYWFCKMCNESAQKVISSDAYVEEN